jgi:hypothetical protein
MKKNLLLALLTAAMLAVTPAVHAKENPDTAKGKPETAEVADKAEKSAPKPKDAAKNLSKEERSRLKAAREKAEADPAVLAASEKEKAARKTFIDAKKSGDEAKSVAAKKALDDAHDAAVKARHDVIAKDDPEAGKLDDRAFAVGERLRKARENKGRDRKGNDSGDAGDDEKDEKDKPVSPTKHDEAAGDDGQPKGRAHAKGKGREHAPGLKKDMDKSGE